MKLLKYALGLIGLALVSGVQASDRAGYFGLMDADTYVGLGVEQQAIKLDGYKDTKAPGLVLKIGTQVSSWVDAEFRVSANRERIELKQSNTTNQTQLDDFYDVSGLFKFKWQGQGWGQPINLHAVLGYNFSEYKMREVAGSIVTSEVTKQAQDGFMYGVGANLRLHPKHAIELSYLFLQSRDSFDNAEQMKRESLGVSWLYHY